MLRIELEGVRGRFPTDRGRSDPDPPVLSEEPQALFIRLNEEIWRLECASVWSSQNALAGTHDDPCASRGCS